jgi:hypothetical protein
MTLLLLLLMIWFLLLQRISGIGNPDLELNIGETGGYIALQGRDSDQ